jgi:hypothetical protein
MSKVARFLSGLIICLSSGTVFSQDLVVFPAGGQDKEQQSRDEYECYGWAKKQSGFDPMAVPTASSPPPQQGAPQGGVARGAVGGAAVGGIVDGSDGAKTGAAVGAVVGGARRNRQRRAQAQQQQNWEQQQGDQYAAARNGYNRAYAACLEGKGYTVK